MKIHNLLIFTFVITSCTACASIIANELGIEKYDQNQCLLQPLQTNSGVILPKGTRGTFTETDGQAMFIVNDSDMAPIFYSITGQNWSMRSCFLN